MRGLSNGMGVELSISGAAQLSVTLLAASISALPEDAGGGAVAATLSIVGSDYVAPASFIITSDPSGLFEIVGDELRVKSGATFDYETTSSYPVIIEGTDGVPNTYSKMVYVPITNVNEVPSDISLNATTISEDAAIGDVIATISSSGDPDAGDSATYTITSDPDSKFLITGTDLKLNGALDYATATSHNVTIRVTDGGGLFYDELFTIDVIESSSFDINALPSLFFNLDGELSAITTGAGSQITDVDDLGPADNDGTQSTSSLQPLTGGSLNGLNAIIFDGLNDILAIELPAAADFSLFFALSRGVQTGSRSLFNNGMVSIFTDEVDIMNVYTTSRQPADTAIPNNTPVVLGLVGSMNGGGTFYFNGVADGTWSGSMSFAASTGIGAVNGTGQAPNMLLGACVYCEEQLSAQNIIDTQNYLTKWIP